MKRLSRCVFGLSRCDVAALVSLCAALLAVPSASAAKIYSEVFNISVSSEMFSYGVVQKDLKNGKELYKAGSYYWTDGQNPSSANDYYVTKTTMAQGGSDGTAHAAGSAAALLSGNAKNLTKDGIDYLSFAGNSLHVCNNFSVYAYSPIQFRFENKGLYLEAGAEIRARNNDATTDKVVVFSADTITTVTNSTLETDSAMIRSTQKPGGFVTYRFLGPLKADASQFLRTPAYTSTSIPGESVLDVRNVKDFKGTLSIGQGTNQGNTNKLILAGADFPGTVTMYAPSALVLDGTANAAGVIRVPDQTKSAVTLTVGSTNLVVVKNFTWGTGPMTFLGGSSNCVVDVDGDSRPVVAASYGCVTVTNNFSKGTGAIVINVGALPARAVRLLARYPLLRVKKTAGALASADYTKGTGEDVTLEYNDDGTWQTIYAVPPGAPIYHDGVGKDGNIAGDSSILFHGKTSNYYSSFTNGMAWSDGRVPHADADYRVPSGVSVRTPKDYGQDVTFGGRSLTFEGGTTLTICSDAYSASVQKRGKVTIPTLCFEGGSTWGHSCRSVLTNSTLCLTNTSAAKPMNVNLNVSETPPYEDFSLWEDVTFRSSASDCLVAKNVATILPTPPLALQWKIDGSQSYGTVSLLTNVNMHIVGASTFAGTLSLSTGCVLRADAPLTVGTLAFGPNGRIICRETSPEAVATVTVTNALTFADKLGVTLTRTAERPVVPREFVCLTFRDPDQTVSLDDFALDLPRNCTATLTAKDASDRRSLVVTLTPPGALIFFR